MSKGSGYTRGSSSAKGSTAEKRIDSIMQSTPYPKSAYNSSAVLADSYSEQLAKVRPNETTAKGLLSSYETEYKSLDKQRERLFADELHKAGLPTHQEYERMSRSQKAELSRKFGKDIHEVINQQSRLINSQNPRLEQMYERARRLEGMSSALRAYAKKASFRL